MQFAYNPITREFNVGSSTSSFVTSFNTRTGAVTLLSSDVITALGFTPIPDTRSVNTGIGLTGGGNLTVDRTLSLSNTTVVPGSYSSTNLTVDAQGRITAASNGTSGGVTSFNTRTGAIVLLSADVTTALGFTPPPNTRSILSGTGLQGGGNLTADRTLSLTDTTVTPGTYTKADITVDQQGRITSASNGYGTSIPQYSVDPGMPNAEDAWVLRTHSTGVGGGIETANLFVPTVGSGGVNTYQFSYQTLEGTTVRATLS